MRGRILYPVGMGTLEMHEAGVLGCDADFEDILYTSRKVYKIPGLLIV